MSNNRYNRIFGENKFAGELLVMLNLERSDIPRYRDAFVYAKNGMPFIMIFNRAGGKFGKHYIPQKQKLGMHPQIMSAAYDSFDETYEYVTFIVPAQHTDRALAIIKEQEPVKVVGDKFKELAAWMETQPIEVLRNDPRFKPDFDQIDEVLSKGGAQVVEMFYDDVPDGFKG